MAETSVSNLLAAIERSKSRPLAGLLVALGIDHVGSEVAELLARRFHTVDALLEASEESLTAIPSIGPKIAEALYVTAVGLAAAIPAVMAYNYFVRRVRVLESEVETFAHDYLNIVKRHFV